MTATLPPDGVVGEWLDRKVAPPPYVERWTERIAEQSAPLPQIWAARIWLHGVLSSVITGAEVGHQLFRDRTLELMRDVGVSEQKIDGFRNQHDLLAPPMYAVLRRLHWYV